MFKRESAGFRITQVRERVLIFESIWFHDETLELMKLNFLANETVDGVEVQTGTVSRFLFSADNQSLTYISLTRESLFRPKLTCCSVK